MRLGLLACLALACACGRNEAEGEPPREGSQRAVDDTAREQARFDSERRPEKIIEALDLHPGSVVADIGASSGLLTVHLARAVAPNGKVVATDIDNQVLEMLEQRLVAVKLSKVVERKLVAADETGLAANTFDAILLAEVDHLFTDPVGWLRLATPALKPNGRIVITNKVFRRAHSVAAAQKAGLVLKTESNPVPSHFIAVFVRGKDK